MICIKININSFVELLYQIIPSRKFGNKQILIINAEMVFIFFISNLFLNFKVK